MTTEPPRDPKSLSPDVGALDATTGGLPGLRALVTLCQTMARDLQAAAERATLDDVQALLSQRAACCAARARELDQSLPAPEGPTSSETTDDARGTPPRPSEPRGDTDLVEACALVEAYAVQRYQEVLTMKLPSRCRDVLVRQLPSVQFDTDLLRALQQRLGNPG